MSALDASALEGNADTVLALLFDENPDGILLFDANGSMRMNAAGRELWGSEAMPSLGSLDEFLESFKTFRADKVTPVLPDEQPLVRALAGKTVLDELLYVQNLEGRALYVSVSARPLAGGGAIVVFRDVTVSRALAEEIRLRNLALTEREQENRELISRLRVAVDELSTPVLEIWDDVLALPVVGIVDTQRSAAMTERLLAEIVRTRCKAAILDLTGVELIDTSTADRFLKLARSVELLGAKCLVTGIQPAVAQTLVELGVEFTNLETYRNLKAALETSIRRDAAARRSHVAP
jgi:rsbT co-antagonist protein RsbR